ncbi:NAD-dependent succinate-semialdehyde dehydrogenase [Pedobacter sp. AW31-3R]|uniref:NAD-dependent succinate-semialdehyde dehydrogenase n=1 Tax=Pedobacter sp. AW31-3R TaxID=3445781 RepID=UPI003FA132E6
MEIVSEKKKSTIKSINPFDNSLNKEFEVFTKEEVNERLDLATDAFRSWKKTSFSERADLLHKVANIFRERKEELAKLASLEMGKKVKEAVAEVELSANIFDYYADKGAEFLADKELETPEGKAFLSYEPLGVLLSVQPWNFPFYQVTRSAAPNIMAGNTMVLKHASIVPQCAAIVEEIFLEAGAPKGVYQNLFLPGASVTDLVSDERVKAVTLTGSEPAGASIAAAAGKNIKKSTLELGGSDPFIVLDDVDVDQVATAAVYGRMWNAGQVCTSAKRIIVHERIADAFLARVKDLMGKLKVGNPLDESTDVAPLSSEKAAEEVVRQVDQAVSDGATLELGGKRVAGTAGAFVEPTLLTHIKKGNSAYSDEIFGPVFMFYVVKDDEEAVALANDTEFGLGGSVFSQDEQRAVAIARQIDTGMVYINHMTGISPELPFGGTKKSGYGREQSPAGIYEFVNPKLIRITSIDKPY